MDCQTLPVRSSKRVALPQDPREEIVLSESDTSSSRDDVHGAIKKILGKDHVGYVLVTCKQPSGAKKGAMEVEMSFDGDPILASYLLDGAQVYIDQNISEDDE